jgi:hypothetical protein
MTSYALNEVTIEDIVTGPRQGKRTKIKMADPISALTKLGQHVGLLSIGNHLRSHTSRKSMAVRRDMPAYSTRIGGSFPVPQFASSKAIHSIFCPACARARQRANSQLNFQPTGIRRAPSVA